MRSTQWTKESLIVGSGVTLQTILHVKGNSNPHAKQTADENTEKYKPADIVLMNQKILKLKLKEI